jgi:hypothetical protein
MFTEVINTTWSFINDDEERDGSNVINLGQEYLQRKRDFLVRIKNFNTFLTEYNCTSIRLPEEEEEEDELREHQNIILIFKYLHGLILDYYKLHAVQEEADTFTEKYNKFRYLTDLRKSIEVEESVKAMIYNILQDVRLITNFTQTNKLEELYVTNFTTELLDLNSWESQLENKKKELEGRNIYLHDESIRVALQDYIQPIVQGTIFVIGFVGNAVLVLIFARQKDVRTAPNMMLLNLAVGDLLNLITNIPAFYSYSMSTKWQYGLHLSKAYRFLRQFGIGVSVYSVTVISIQKFIAVTASDRFRRYGYRIKKNLKLPLTVSVVWTISCVIAVPHTVHAGIYDGNCYAASFEHDYYPKAITLLDLLFFCLVPLVIIIILSGVSACKLKRSVRKLIGQPVGTDDHKQARNISSNVLIVLAILSAVSYIPYDFLFFLYTWTDFNMSQSTYYVVFFITYTLSFGNSCFNTIALYVTCRKFRGYFNIYLFCRRERKQ